MEELKNDDMPIGFLIHLFYRAFKRRIRKICVRNGINSTYGYIVSFLHHSPNQQNCQNAIVDHVRLKAPTISLTLKQMEQLNLIERKNDVVDTRKTICSLTKAGNDFSKKFQECINEAENDLLKNVEEEEIVQFRSIFKKMMKNIEGDN